MDSDVARYGKAMRAVTYYLGSHPLLQWLKNAVNESRTVHAADETTLTAIATVHSVEEQANLRLRKLLGIKPYKGNILPKTLEKQLKQSIPEKVRPILSEMHEQYPETEALRRLEQAYANVFTNRPRES